MNTKPLIHTRHRNTITLIVGAWIVTFGLLVGTSVSASAQEIFALSTESGLELYQVGKLIEPDLLINTYQSAVSPKIQAGAFRLQPFSVPGKILWPLLVQSGLQTTPNGRILTMAGRIDWHPSSEGNPLNDDLVASLTGTNPR